MINLPSSPFVCIFMQITGDPMRSAKLLFDLKVALGDFPSESMYLRLLVRLIQKFCESKIESHDVFISIRFSCSFSSMTKSYGNGTMAFESMQRFNASVPSTNMPPGRSLGFCTMLVLGID